MPHTYSNEDMFNKATGLPRRPAIRNESGLPMGRLPYATPVSSHMPTSNKSALGPFRQSPVQPPQNKVVAQTPAPQQHAPSGSFYSFSGTKPNGTSFSESGTGAMSKDLGAFGQPSTWQENLKLESEFNAAHAAQQKQESDFFRDRDARNNANMAQQISPREAIAMAQAQAAMTPSFKSDSFGASNKINAMADAIRMKSNREALSGEAGNKAVAALHGVGGVDASANMHNAQANLASDNAAWVGPQAQADIAQKYGHASYYQNKPKADAFAATQRGSGAIGLKPSDIVKYQFQALKDFGDTDKYKQAIGFLGQFKPVAGTSSYHPFNNEQEG